MAIFGKNGKAHVLEISNRASIQSINIEAVTSINTRIDNHIGILNTNAHEIQNIFGLEDALNNKEPKISLKNTAFNKNFGTTSDTVCEGNDSRLSDARTPTSHTHSIADITDLIGYTGTLNVVTSVNFIGQTVTNSTITIENGIITSIA